MSSPPVRTLPRGWRRAVLVTHIVAAGGWIGIDVLVAVLVLAGRFAGSNHTRALAYEALGTFVLWPMLTCALLSLATGILLGLGTRWGLLRYRWVVTKLVLNLVLCALIIVLLRPMMPDVVDWGVQVGSGAPLPADVSNLYYPPAVSLSILTLATTLGVVKPWGRMRGTSTRRTLAARNESP